MLAMDEIVDIWHGQMSTARAAISRTAARHSSSGVLNEIIMYPKFNGPSGKLTGVAAFNRTINNVLLGTIPNLTGSRTTLHIKAVAEWAHAFYPDASPIDYVCPLYHLGRAGFLSLFYEYARQALGNCAGQLYSPDAAKTMMDNCVSYWKFVEQQDKTGTWLR
jgi:hypothetical protein